MRAQARRMVGWGVVVAVLCLLPSAWAEELPAYSLQGEESSMPSLQEEELSIPPLQGEKQEEPSAQGEETVTLNFEDADIRAVIHSFATALGFSYRPDPRVQGKVTVRTTEPIPKRDLWPLFHHILRSSGLAAVKEGDLYQIIPLSEAKTKLLFSSPERQEVEAEDGFVIELVRVEHMAVADMVNAIQPFVSPGGDIVTYAPGNLLIITDLASNVQRLRSIITAFDTSAADAARAAQETHARQIRTRLYRLKHASVDKLAEELKQVLAASGITLGNVKENSLSIVPLPRLNSVAVITSNPAIFPQVQQWIEEFDLPVALQLKLVGVFIVSGQEEALLLDSSQDGGKALRVKVGGEIGGYRLVRVERTRVVLKGPGGDEVNLPLVVIEGEQAAKAPQMEAAPADSKAPAPAQGKEESQSSPGGDGSTPSAGATEAVEE